MVEPAFAQVQNKPVIWLAADEASGRCGLELRNRLEEELSALPAVNEGAWIGHLHVRTEQKQRHGLLELTTGGKKMFERAIAATTCKRLGDALILSLQIFTDELAAAPGQSPKPVPDPDRDRANSVPDAADESTTAPPPRSASERAGLEESPRTPERSGTSELLGPRAPQSLQAAPAAPISAVHPRLLGGPLVAHNLLHELSVGVVLGAAVPLSRLWAITGTTEYYWSDRLETPVGEYEFATTSFSLGVERQLFNGAPFRIHAGASAVASVTHAVSYTGVTEEPAHHLSMGVGFTLGGEVRLWGPLTISLLTSPRAYLLRARYLHADEVEIWEQPRFGGWAGALLGWSPKIPPETSEGRGLLRTREHE